MLPIIPKRSANMRDYSLDNLYKINIPIKEPINPPKGNSAVISP